MLKERLARNRKEVLAKRSRARTLARLRRARRLHKALEGIDLDLNLDEIEVYTLKSLV